VINYFKTQGCYVIGGVPTWWRNGVSDSRPDFLTAYSAFNMLSPWMMSSADRGELEAERTPKPTPKELRRG